MPVERCPKCGDKEINITSTISVLGIEKKLSCGCGYKSITFMSNTRTWGKGK